MLPVGTRLGSYEVVSVIGTGGMGEVYKGRDTRLDRTVALKVLPPAHAANSERNLRFAREARAISSLSHPNICALYDLGEQDGIPFLVMEYLEGETLEERLRKGPLSIEEALRCGIQMAEALDHAHRLGIVHRDLKPANVMLTRGGVKLLDFGLAKAMEPAAAATAMTSLPTASRTLTAEGSIVGTFQYMAPEQLEGAEADARSDLFAFGTVLYEMLTGKRAFQGKSQASLIAAIMSGALPPISNVQPMTPPALEHLVQTCLAKDPDARWQTARDVLVQLKWIAEGGSQVGAPRQVASRRKYREWTAWAAAITSILALAAVSWIHFSEARPAPAPIRFSIEPPEGLGFPPSTAPVVSPDGRKLVFNTFGGEGHGELWLRFLDSPAPRELATTGFTASAFWSPDSRFVAFFSDGKLLKIDTTGGPPITLCATAPFLGGAWSSNGVILMGSSTTNPSMRRVSASGGDPKIVLQPNPALHETFLSWPLFLPDGRHFLFLSLSTDTAKNGIRIGTLDSTETSPLLLGDGRPSYASPGYLLFPRQQTLFAQPFDARRLRLTGEAEPIAEGIGSGPGPGMAFYSSSQNGVLTYHGGEMGNEQLTWYNSPGGRNNSVLPPGRFRQTALSPDGRRAAIERMDAATSHWAVWLLDLGSGILSRLTGGTADETDPVWSPDGRQVAFASNRNGQLDVFRQAIGSSVAEPVWTDGERKVPEAWSNDGTILFTTANGKNYYQISPDAKARPKLLFHSDSSTDEPMVSPNGRWISFNSLESGRWELYLATFPGFTDKRQVSKDGGAQGRWRADSKELYFLSPDGKMMAVEIKPGRMPETGLPHSLFQTDVRVSPFWDQYGVTGDGSRFLVADSSHEPPKPINVVLNWPELLRR